MTASPVPGNAQPVRLLSADGGSYVEPGGAPVTPAAGSASVVTTGGAAVVCATGPINGGFVSNPVDAAAQGLGAAENLYIDMVGVPGSTDGAANGTTSLLYPGQPFTLPALAAGVQVRVNAASNGHKFTVVIW